MRKKWKLMWIIVRSIILFVLLTCTTIAIVENIETDVLVQNFMKKGVYQSDISTDTVKYYKVGNSSENVTDPQRLDLYPGNAGDILCSTEQTTIAPVINDIISFYVGGHAGYCLPVYGDYSFSVTEDNTLEATQTNGPDTSCHSYFKTDWSTREYFNKVIGLRTDMTEEERAKVTSVICSYMDDPYNNSFIFDTVNKSYCTDIESKAFSYIGKDLNRDGFIVSVFDIILSKDTYISYYHYFDNDGIKYIYYLG